MRMKRNLRVGGREMQQAKLAYVLFVYFYSLQTQVSEMSLNLTRKIDALQCDRYLDSGMQLHQIKTQLQQLTRSVDTCHSEVHEVSIKNNHDAGMTEYMVGEKGHGQHKTRHRLTPASQRGN